MLADEDILTEWNRDVKFERGELTAREGRRDHTGVIFILHRMTYNRFWTKSIMTLLIPFHAERNPPGV